MSVERGNRHSGAALKFIGAAIAAASVIVVLITLAQRAPEENEQPFREVTAEDQVIMPDDEAFATEPSSEQSADDAAVEASRNAAEAAQAVAHAAADAGQITDEQADAMTDAAEVKADAMEAAGEAADR